MTILESMLQYSLYVVMAAMGAAFVYFLMQSVRVPDEYRATVVLSGVIVGIACVMYFFMATKYVPGKEFPVAFRYADWTVTTPLLVAKFADFVKAKERKWAIILVVADIEMIVTGYLGKMQGTEPSGAFWYLFWGTISTIGYLVILYVIFKPLAQIAAHRPKAIRNGYNAMKYFPLIAWGVYPLGYLETLFKWFSDDYVELAFNVGDVVNKIIFGLIVFWAIRALMEERGVAYKEPKEVPLEAIRSADYAAGDGGSKESVTRPVKPAQNQI